MQKIGLNKAQAARQADEVSIRRVEEEEEELSLDLSAYISSFNVVKATSTRKFTALKFNSHISELNQARLQKMFTLYIHKMYPYLKIRDGDVQGSWYGIELNAQNGDLTLKVPVCTSTSKEITKNLRIKKILSKYFHRIQKQALLEKVPVLFTYVFSNSELPNTAPEILKGSPGSILTHLVVNIQPGVITDGVAFNTLLEKAGKMENWIREYSNTIYVSLFSLSSTRYSLPVPVSEVRVIVNSSKSLDSKYEEINGKLNPSITCLLYIDELAQIFKSICRLTINANTESFILFAKDS